MIELTIEEKCKAVADGFDWYKKAAERYLEDGDWTDGQVAFVNERYSVLERVQSALGGGDYKLSIPLPLRTSKNSSSWYVALSTPVTGFRCKEHLHLLILQGHDNSILLYRTKDQGRVLEAKATVSGKVRVRDEKVKFGGFDIPVASKVDLT